MENLDLLILVVASLVNLMVGLVIYLKDYRHLTHQLFGCLTISLVAWTTANYFSIASSSDEAIFLAIKYVLSFVVLQNTFFFLFASAFPNHKFNISKQKVIIYTGLSAITFLSGAFIGFFSGYISNGESISPQPSPVMALFILHTLVSIFGGFINLNNRQKKSDGLQKKQLRFLIVASSALYLVAPFTNFILPTVFGINSLLALAPLYTLAFSLLIAYAIVSQSLFDIRAAVARSAAYVTSLSFIGVVYGTVAFVLLSILGIDDASQTTERIFFVGIAVATATLFPATKRFFDRITNKVFFQDSYEPQKFLDELNEVLVVNIELDKLLTETINVLERNLKTNFCVFSIRETSYFPRRIIGDTRKRFDDSDIQELGKASSHLHEKVIFTDSLDDQDIELKKTLHKNDIAVLVRLVATLDYEVQGVGYILFGAKKSGNTYNKQDIQTLEIIANELVIAIQNGLRFEEIEKFNITLQEKVDEATKQLRRTNEKLKALDETKDEFISMASHQLRTPLTSVKGYLSMVLEGDAGDVGEMQRKLLDQAYVSSQRMVYLIADLLNVSRLRTGKFIIEAVASNLADVVEGEIGQLKETAAGRGLELTYDKPDNFPTLFLDETKLRQVIMNFTDNAIYYTPKGGHINVKLEDKDESIELTVTDDGMGVPKSEQPHLFTKFYRAGNAQKARPDGTGLGLFMAKKVIVAQGGSLIFRSEEGKGSTFGFSFPKAKLQTPPAPATEKNT
jgi:signal transduction histidine kinase